MNQPRTRTSLLLITAAAALALSACNRPGNDERSTGERLDSAAATAEATADRLGDKVADATITASVNAELAKDPSLSALRIDVDTAAGRVMLKGTAPDASARDRATQLAMNVKGVVAVDNQLQIRG